MHQFLPASKSNFIKFVKQNCRTRIPTNTSQLKQKLKQQKPGISALNESKGERQTPPTLATAVAAAAAMEAQSAPAELSDFEKKGEKIWAEMVNDSDVRVEDIVKKAEDSVSGG